MVGDGRRLLVRGGPGGTTANLVDIERCAAALRNAAKAVDDAWFALGSLQMELDVWSNTGTAATPEGVHAASVAVHARHAVDAVRSGLLPFGTELRDDARDVDAARKRYEGAESFASKAFRTVVGAVFPLYGVARFPAPFEALPTLPVVLAEHAKWRAGLGISAEFVERYVNVFAAQLVRLGPGHVYVVDDPVPVVSGWFARVAGLFSVPKELLVQPVIGAVRRGKASRGAADMIDRYAHGYGPDGKERIQVTKVTNPDGSVAWEVTIPGTQDAGLRDGDHPNNMKSNFELLADLPSHATAAVLEAMALSGVGKDDPVVLVGHSQGGKIAQDIAGAGAFNVVGVLAAGSPLGARHQRSTVPTLALEHESDLVTALDGKQNPDDPLTTTVSIRPNGRAKDMPSDAHRSAEYAETAALVDADDAESLVAWRKILAETFDEGAVAETRAYDAALRPLG